MPSPLRVLLITDWMPRHGGAEVYASTIRAGLAAAGDEVRLLTSSAGSAADGTADFVAFGTERRAAQAVLQVVNPFAAWRTRVAVRTFRPDVALVHLFAYHLSPAALWPLRDTPTAMMVLDYKIVCPLGSKLLPTGQICEKRAGIECRRSECLSTPHWIRDQARYAVIKPVVEKTKLVLACSRHIQRELQSNGIASAYLPLPVAAPHPSFSRRPAAHPELVFCGRLSVEKGLPLLVRAFARLHQQLPSAHLKIVGDGPLMPDVVALVQAHRLADAVTFTGWLDPLGVDRQLETAWALVAPAIWAEPLGLVALEGIVRGVPVVGSQTGGLGESVEDGVSGLLFPNGDEDRLYQALEIVATGDLFPSHSLDPTVVARAVETFDVTRHVLLLRAHLQRIASRVDG